MTGRFRNQYFSIMGDSISTFEGYIPVGFDCFYNRLNRNETNVYDLEETWWGRVLRHFEGKLLVNNSWSGSLVSKVPEGEADSCGCCDRRAMGLHEEALAPDQILVFIGTNDRGHGVPLTSKDKNDLFVIENAYGVMLDKMKKRYPEAEIWCMTFPKTTCSQEPRFFFPSRNGNGVPMVDYNKLIRKTASERGCHVIELFDHEMLCDTLDGLHPNYDGMKMIAEKVIFAMEQEA